MDLHQLACDILLPASLICQKGLLLANVQSIVHKHTQVLLCKAALKLIGAQPALTYEIVSP